MRQSAIADEALSHSHSVDLGCTPLAKPPSLIQASNSGAYWRLDRERVLLMKPAISRLGALLLRRKVELGL
jgi:hypothetical protein